MDILLIVPMPSHPNFKNLVGREFGRLRVLAYTTCLRGRTRWICECSCGTIKAVLRDQLLQETTVSCGCYNTDICTSHGMYGTPEYKAWQSMLQRCENSKCPEFSDYGERGISVCRRWHDFELFFSDVGKRPGPGYSLDRFPDNNGDYKPDNVRWATWKQQHRNKRSNTHIVIDGVSRCIAEWCEVYGIYDNLVNSRIHELGWNPIRAITTPIMDGIACEAALKNS